MTSSIPDGLLDIASEDDSELLLELHDVLEKHGVDEGLAMTIMDMVGRWEMENCPSVSQPAMQS